MTIGFLSSQLSFLGEYKNTITKYPEFNYVFCGDTLHAPYSALSSTELSEVLETACSFLLKKDVSLVVIDSDVDKAAVVQFFAKLGEKNMSVITLNELPQYLQELTDVENEEVGAQTRIVHLTQHNESNDEAIAEILGGFIIEA